MRKVEIRVTCDPCAAWKGQEVSAGVETVPVVAGHTLDVCPDHRTGLREVLGLIAEWSAAPEATRPRKPRPAAVVEEAPAVVEPEAAPKRNRRGGKRARARREAAPVVEAPVVVDGERLSCPLCTHTSPTTAALGVHLGAMHQTTPTAVYGLSCPLCGYTGGNGAALGNHARRAHDLATGVPGLFDRARAEGDPLGIVAARAAAYTEEAASPP